MNDGGARRAVRAAALGAILLLGVFLRVVRWREWPGGPWIDEIYFLRAARVVDAHPETPFFGTTPLLPPEFSGHGTLYPTNVYLRVVAAVDNVAGGGMATLRALSIGSAIGLFLGGLLVAWEATRHRPEAFLPAALLLAASIWLLTQGRWATDVVSTSALLAWAAGAALAASRSASGLVAALAGALLGLAQYGYVQSRLALLAPVAVAAWAALRRDPRLLRLAAAAALSAALVAAPLFFHLARNPGRATAHVEDLFILGRPPARALAALGANVRDYAALFTTRGDAIPRHGDPTRPVVLPGVAALLAVGLALALRRPGAERFLALLFCLFLAGALLARDTESANASRLSPAAPFVLVLAALGGGEFVARAGRFRAAALGALWAVVLGSAALDAAAFVRWARSPAAWVPFGVPERDLADAVAAEIAAGGPAEVLLHPVAGARNVYLVDVLLGRPGDGGRHAVGTAALESTLPWTHRPSRDILWAAGDDDAAARAAAALGGRPVARRQYPPYGRIERPRWVLFRIPRERAAKAAEAALAGIPLLPASPSGNLAVPREALYQIATGGGVAARLDGRGLFPLSPDGPGTVLVRLAAGFHELRWSRIDPRGNLVLTGPDGFVIPLEGARQEPSASSSAS